MLLSSVDWGPERMLVVLAQASKPLCLYPYQGSAVPLCGYTFSSPMPWPEETEKVPPYRIDAPGFLVEEVVPDGQPLHARIEHTLALARERRLKPFAGLSAAWCTPCIELFEVFGDAQMTDALQGIHLLKLDYDQWSDAFAGIGLHNLTTLPLLVELNGEGMYSGRSLAPDAWEETTAPQVAQALGPFFKGAVSS